MGLVNGAKNFDNSNSLYDYKERKWKYTKKEEIVILWRIMKVFLIGSDVLGKAKMWYFPTGW